MHDMTDVDFLHQLRAAHRDIDRCLDLHDPRAFSRASQKRQDLLSRLRELIEHISVAEIAARVTSRG
jgi:hypothetical protein